MVTPTVASWLLRIDQVRLQDRPQVGGKAAVLGVLRQAGLPVPAGFCIPWQTLQKPAQSYQAALWEAYAELAPRGEPVAVRSSGLAEDSQAASFAGIFETVLNVRSREELELAIQRCQQGALSVRARSYQDATGAAEQGLSILVQRQVAAQVSGVLFTLDPRTGFGGNLWVEATPGLGENLVGGMVEPISLRLSLDGTILEGALAPGLDQESLHTLAQLSASIEALLGKGQDIEWAVDEQGVWILQARPITPAAARIPLAQIWTRANVGEVLPHPVTPLTWAVFRATLQGDLSRFWAVEEGEAVEGVRRLNGRVAVRLDAFLDSFCYLPYVTSETMRQVLGVEVPPQASEYHRPGGLAVRLAQGLFWLDLLGALPRLEWLARRYEAALPKAAPENLTPLLTWTMRLFGLHLRTTGYAIGAYAVLKAWTARWLPERTPAFQTLLEEGGSLQSAQQGRDLWALAESIRAQPELEQALFEDPMFLETAAQLPGGSAFLQAWEVFLEKNGARAAGEFELATPRWQEDPAFVMEVLGHYVRMTQSSAALRPSSEQPVAAVLSPFQRFLFQRAWKAERRYTRLRENVKYRLMEGYFQVRRVFLEMGEKLQAQGMLSKVEDVFLLTPAEIRQAQSKSLDAGEVSSRIEKRRKQLEAWSAQASPDLWIGEGEVLPTAEPGTLCGIASSPGVVTGIARVLFHSEQANQLQPGEILVAPHTDPGWTPLFLTCKAVVTEIGGFLSHGATVAREYGIPCVVNVHGATTMIRTGDLLRVDGTRGRIEIL